ncbi:MAG: AAA family ATPase, partial [Cyanobacteria bacterium Co-bin13]|nr:AAA family ATPase [Cyanobacteria bacterium Co-bin13]
MNFADELSLLIRARYPIIYIATSEEERAEGAIAHCARDQGSRGVYVWDFVDGYQGNLNDAGFGRRNPLQALELIEKLPASAAAIFILRDYHRFLDDVAISRKLRNLTRLLKSQPKNIVILSPQLTIPDDLGELITVLDFALPAPAEIRTEVERLLVATGSSLSAALVDELVQTCQGLSLERIRRVLARAIAAHGSFQASDLDLIL